MGVSATHIAVSLFRSHPLYAAKSTDFANDRQNDGLVAEDAIAQFKPNYSDSLEISNEYKAKMSEEDQKKLPKELRNPENREKTEKTEDKKTDEAKSDKNEKTTANGKKLDEKQQEAVRKLEKRDAEVRTHEQAHIAAGGGLVRGGASYTYEAGPDGKQYAIGGEVQIDMNPIAGDPQGTISKMQQVQRAAMAPAEPSSQDYSVANTARKHEAEARKELAEQSSGAATSKAKETKAPAQEDEPQKVETKKKETSPKVSAQSQMTLSMSRRNTSQMNALHMNSQSINLRV